MNEHIGLTSILTIQITGFNIPIHVTTVNSKTIGSKILSWGLREGISKILQKLIKSLHFESSTKLRRNLQFRFDGCRYVHFLQIFIKIFFKFVYGSQNTYTLINDCNYN